MKKSNKLTQSEQGHLSANDLLRLGEDGVAKVAELYGRFDKHIRRQLRDGQWHPVIQVVHSIPTAQGKLFLQLGLPLPELAGGADRHTQARFGIMNFYRHQLLSSDDLEGQTQVGHEEIRLRLSATPRSRRKVAPKRTPASPSTEPKCRTFAQLLADYFLPVCTGCRVATGEFHENKCRAELCPYCGKITAIDCQCPTQKKLGLWPQDDRRRYDGFPLAWLEAIEFGWFGYDGPQGDWIPCGADDHHDSYPDWIRVMEEAQWDRNLKRYVLPTAN